MPDYEEIIKQSQDNVNSLSEKLRDFENLHQDIKTLKESAVGIPDIFNKKFEEIVKLSEDYTNILGVATKNYLEGNNTLFTTKLSELSTKLKRFEKKSKDLQIKIDEMKEGIERLNKIDLELLVSKMESMSEQNKLLKK